MPQIVRTVPAIAPNRSQSWTVRALWREMIAAWMAHHRRLAEMRTGII